MRLFLRFLHREDCCGVFWLFHAALDAPYSLKLRWTIIDLQENRALFNVPLARGSLLRLLFLNQKALLLFQLLLMLVNFDLSFEFFLLRRKASRVAEGRKTHLVQTS